MHDSLTHTPLATKRKRTRGSREGRRDDGPQRIQSAGGSPTSCPAEPRTYGSSAHVQANTYMFDLPHALQ